MVEVQDSFVISATSEAILTKASLASVLQVYSDDRRSCTLTVKSDLRTGTIHLRQGVLIHSEFGLDIGDKAFLELAQWEKPDLIIVDRLRSEMHSVKQSLQSLLLEAARLRDEGEKEFAGLKTVELAPVQPNARQASNLKSLLEALLHRPGTTGVLIWDYTNDHVVMSLGKIRSPEALAEFYSLMLRTSKRISLTRNSERLRELSLVLGEEQHLLVPVPYKELCLVHIGRFESDTRALYSTLMEIVNNLGRNA